MSRRTAGPGSSPGLSTKQRTKLWMRLRKLDGLCSKYADPRTSSFFTKLCSIFITPTHFSNAANKKREALWVKYDLERKTIRNKLKQNGKQKRDSKKGSDHSAV